MNKRRSRVLASIAAASLLALPSVSWGQKAYTLQIRVPDQLESAAAHYLNFAGLGGVVEDADDAATPRWIGLHVNVLPEVLRTHLKLEHGVLVEDVFADSPAAKAGLQKNDVLLAVDGNDVTQPEQVRDAVAELEEGGTLKFKVLQAGEEKTVSIVPEERPPLLANPTATASGAASSQQEFLRHQHQALKALERALADRQAAGMMFMRPGIITQKPVKLPKDVTVIIKHHDGKKTIVVERGDDQWDVTEDTLDQLPEELREPVAATIHGPMPFARRLNGDDIVRVAPGAVRGNDLRIDVVPPKVRVLESEDSSETEAVIKELKALRKQVDELQRSLKDN